MTCWFRALNIALIFACFAGTSLAADRQKMYSVSVQQLKGAAKEERVVSFEFKVAAGAIRSVSNVPVGWKIVIDNDPSWQTTVRASVVVGSAALQPEDLRSVRLTVEKNEFGDLKFAVSGVVSLTGNFESERGVQLAMQDFAIKSTR
jgi:hypothetical protein